MMRALQFSQFGEPADVLQLVKIDTPPVQPGSLRLRLTHRAINPSDLLTIRGYYGRLPQTLPVTPGNEAVGVIEAIGEGVQGFTLGQRVIPLGINTTWQEYVLAQPLQLIPVLDGISDQTAAQFVVNPITAWVMLTQSLQLEEGDWILQTAAGSTLGRLVLQIAQLKGYKTINFVRRQAQVQELLDLGADVVICTKDDDVIEQVKALTDGKGVKAALDAVAGETGALAASCLRGGGTMLVYGALSMEPTPIQTGEMIFKGTTIQGFWLAYWFQTTPIHEIGPIFMELMQLMAAGQLVPPVEATYDLADFKEAILHAERPGRSGKVLFTG